MRNRTYVWGKLVSWNPSRICHAETLEELVKEIRLAKRSRAKIKIAGSLHSLNDLCATEHTQIYLDRISQPIFIDARRCLAKFQGGIKIKNLLKALAQEGLTLPNQGYIDEQTIAGALATATHGSGRTGTLSSFIREIELVDANGDLQVLTRDSNPHIFSAAAVSLGCLGIVYSVTLKCIPLEKLHLSKVPGTVSEMWKSIPRLLTHKEHFQVVVDPYSDRMFTWQFDKTSSKARRRWLYQAHRAFMKMLVWPSFELFYPPSLLMPSCLKLYMKLSSFRSCVDYSYRLLSPSDEGHYVEEEISVPIIHFEKAFMKTREIIDNYSEKGERMVAIMMIRFVNGDPFGYMSPTIGRHSAYISLIAFPKKGYQRLFYDFETALYKFEGRPHWGKVNFLTREVLASLYGSNYQQFCKARRELDPQGMFANEHIEKLF